MKKIKAILLSALLMVSPFVSAQLLYKEGHDFFKTPTVIDEGTKPKIIEFFWLGCPHCYSAEKPLNEWLKDGKPENIQFEKIPAIPSENWGVSAHIYYTMLELGLDITDELFREVHDKTNKAIIFNPDKAKEYFVRNHNVKAEDFDKAFKSFAVQQKMTRAKALFDASGIDSVPMFVVNGQYIVPINEKDYAVFFKKLGAMTELWSK